MTRICWLVAACALIAGCGKQRQVTVREVLPDGAYATPWILTGRIWSGEFAQAAEALGEDAEGWRAFAPQCVWLAVYRHDTYPLDQIVVRVFAFATADDARAAYEFFQPARPTTIHIGDQACWTDDGVLMRWGRLVFEVFGRGMQQATPEQSLYVLALIEKRVTAELVADPR